MFLAVISTIKGVNALTGAVDYSGADATRVIQAATDTLGGKPTRGLKFAESII